MSGLIESNENPISYYLNDQHDPGQVTCAVICHATYREENLDLFSLVNKQVPQLLTEKKEDQELLAATHVVASVFYGAEVYCIFADIDGIEADEGERNKIEKNISILLSKWVKALDEFKEPLQFQKQFNSQEKHLITRLKCRLFASLQTQPIIECSYFDSYTKSFEVMKTIFTFESSKAVPVAIQLCPLNVLLAENDEMAKLNYRDVDYSLVDRCSRLLAELNRVVVSAKKIYGAMIPSSDSDSLPEFIGLVSKFQALLKAKLNQSVVVARSSCDIADSGLISTLKDAETNLIFNSSKLKRWLKLKEAEVDIVDWMAKAAGTGIDFLAKDKLEKYLRNSLETDYSVVLYVPPLDESTREILKSMNNFADKLEEFGSLSSSGFWEHIRLFESDKQSWYNESLQKKFVFHKIRELAAHVERNKKIEKQVNCIVSFSE